MDQSDRVPKQVDAHIKDVDSRLPAPEERAEVVWELIRNHFPNLTNWDLTCFSANYLGFISQEMPWLEEPAKHICRLVYTAHYLDRQTDIETGLRSMNGNGSDPRQTASRDSSADVSGERVPKFTGFDVSGGGFR